MVLLFRTSEESTDFGLDIQRSTLNGGGGGPGRVHYADEPFRFVLAGSNLVFVLSRPSNLL